MPHCQCQSAGCKSKHTCTAERKRCADSFLLHRDAIRTSCGQRIPAPTLETDAHGAAQAIYDPCEGPYGTVTFTGTAHGLVGDLAAWDPAIPSGVTIDASVIGGCSRLPWCTFPALQSGQDFDESNAPVGTWVTFHHACVVPSKEIADALACGQILLSVVTEVMVPAPQPGMPFAFESIGEVRGIVCVQERVPAHKYRAAKKPQCHRPGDGCVKHTIESSKPKPSTGGDCGCGCSGGNAWL